MGQERHQPDGVMLSGVMMLHHLEEDNAANALENAIAAVIKEGKDVTSRPQADP